MTAKKKKAPKPKKAAGTPVRPRGGQVQLDMFGEGAAQRRAGPAAAAPASQATLTIVGEETNKAKAAKAVKDAAQLLAARQREISVSEFFTKNRHLLGFDNPQKALLTAVKEAVDNSLDACEEAGIVPEVNIDIVQCSPGTGALRSKNGNGHAPPEKGAGGALVLRADDQARSADTKNRLPRDTAVRFKIAVQDNGPGIVKNQIPKIFGKLLYGSKFHRIKQSRGQQGIGISAAGMYGQLTTGRPMQITSRIGDGKPAHYYEIQIDTRRNAPLTLVDREVEWDPPHGTRVEIEIEAVYKKGRRSVDDFVEQTVLANPHATIRFSVTGDEPRMFPRVTDAMPKDPVEIRPHPYGVELGMLMRMMAETSGKTLRKFFTRDFSRVSPRLASEICEKAGVAPEMKPHKVLPGQAELLYRALSATKFMAPPTNCLSPIGRDLILEGLEKQFKADLFYAVSRPPAVYRGNPFLVECGVAYAGDLPAEEPVTLYRFANRVPLLYQQSACAITKSVTQTSWKSYNLQQPRGALPTGPLVLMIHIASVWVPFTSESKEAIASYPEIVREIRLALMECGRQVSAHIRRHRREADAMKKISYIEKYIPHVGIALREILKLSEKQESKVVETLKDTLQRSRLKTAGGE
ncbi:MAG: DNA topoisomerase VI subunit B [Deltaproteobacteria bacterium]|nr:DNA topoisomerase VI subunit B [Deltaproteobacteria bacterium]